MSNEDQKSIPLSVILIGLVLPLMMGTVVVIGWWQDIMIMKTLLPDRPDMKPNCAVFLIVSCFAIALAVQRPVSVLRRRLSIVLASVTAIFSALTILEYVIHQNIGIDQLFILDTNLHSHSPPGRFSPVSAANFIFISLGLLFELVPRKSWSRVSQALWILCFLNSLPSFLGNAFGINDAFGMGLFIPMAVHTALSFTLLSAAALSSRFDEGYIARFTSDRPSCLMARRMLIAVVAVPPLIRGIATYGASHGWWHENFAVFMQAMGGMLFMSMIVITTAGALVKAESEREKLRDREREAFAKARAERDRLHALFLQAPSHVDMFTGPNHVIDLAHPLTVKLAGRGDIRGLPFGEAFPAATHEGLIEIFDQVYKTGLPFYGKEVSAVSAEGTTHNFNVSVQPRRDTTGEVEGLIMFAVDVTEHVQARKLAEQSREEAKRNANQLRLVTDALPTLISYIGREGRYLVVNHTFEKWFSRPKIAFLGKTIAEALTPEVAAVAQSFLERALAGENVTFQNTMVGATGNNISVETTFVPDRDDTGFVRGVVELSHDVTAARQLEQELTRAKVQAEEANSAKSQFLANMSHEIRTPLGVILGFAELASETVENREATERYLASIHRNAEQLSELLGDVLDLAKVEAKKIDIEIVRFPLHSVLNGVRNLLEPKAQQKGVHFEIQYSGRVPTYIETDPTRLRQILINLVGNAIKFTDKGRVLLRVGAKEAEGAGALGEPLQLYFEVIDTGLGISYEQQGRLFKPFQQADSSMTRKFGGTGLGLSLSRELAIALGGRLELVRSALHEGTEFMVTVGAGPIRPDSFEARSPLSPNSAQFKSISLEGLRVLLVEDAIENQTLVSHYLRPTGATLDLAGNGKEGLEKIANNDYDVVLMDIQMPVLDGFRATQALRENGYMKPVIALTAHAVQAERQRALASGFNAYITKPINRVQLLETLRSYHKANVQGANPPALRVIEPTQQSSH